MPGAKRFHLAQTLATVALGAATLAIAYAGQLPALAYGPPPPPPAPGGYTAVVTSVTAGPAGAQVGPVVVDGCHAILTIPPGTFKTPVQVSITAPTVQGVGDAGHPGYHAVCGVGVLIQVNGKPYTGTFGHRITLDISGFGISAGDRVAVWNGKQFVFVGAAEAGHTVRVSVTGPSEDFAVLAPGGGGGGGVAAAVRSSHGARTEVLTAMFLAPSVTPAGIGVLAPEWMTAISR